ncbi:glycosyltransferase family 9 protein [Pseudanabaena sp. FACHB-2040]|uniref:glycosyltransferase family 9 protein n=1 Tax=Pseudanabaena sp. FACHB-2040 TaxID=2692859 RepID=UPI001682DFC0|nr:glycosyltransferase family 9 protein [Pseudanabaena sp. FACHB-2040]MBD2257216.1 glycosyltransferase family 9 protein [Pseudanabaena sp. FACHB-2040]
MAPVGRIVVVRSLPGLGDLLCTVPALRALRSAFPAAHITLLGLPGSRWMVERFPDLLDDWLAFPGYPGIPEGWQSVQTTVQFLAQTQAQPFDLAIQMHGNGSYMNSFVTLLGAKQTAGFYMPGLFCPSPESFLPYPQDAPEVERMLQLMEFLGIPSQGSEMAFPVTEAEVRSHQQLATAHGLQPYRYLCLHPGASDASRRWSPANFAQVADHLAIKGYRIVLTGTDEEQPIIESVISQMHTQPINLAGKTNLGTLAALLQQTALLICNDTGVSHLAAALKTPSIVIFSNSEVKRWAPLNRQYHRPIDCREAGIATTAAVLVQANEFLRQLPKSLSREEVSHAV